MKHLKRMLAWLLIAVMLSSTLPISAVYIADTEEEAVEEEAPPDISPEAWEEEAVEKGALADVSPDALEESEEDALPVSDAPRNQTPAAQSPPARQSSSTACRSATRQSRSRRASTSMSIT